MKMKTKDIPKVKSEILEKQRHRCSICRISLLDYPTKDVCLDHCHVGGHVRGVLCRNCNGIEGKIHNLVRRGKRSATPKEYLARLLSYWAEHATNVTGYVHPTHKSPDEKREHRNKMARKRRAVIKAKHIVGSNTT